MPEQHVVMQSISWRDFCPWLILVRCFRLAISFQLLSLATLAVLLTPVGWWLCGQLLFEVDDGNFKNTADNNYTSQIINELASWPSAQAVTIPPHVPRSPEESNHFYQAVFRIVSHGPVLGVWRRLNLPFRHLLGEQEQTLSRFTYFLVGGLWTMLVWSFFGGALTRSAALQLSAEERPSFREVLNHATSKLGSYFAAPFLPMLLVTAAALLVMFSTGLLSRWDTSLWLAGILLGPSLLIVMIAMIVLLGLYLGWPLMWGAISTEGTDAFDAISRSYSYTFQRPLHYLFYIAITVILGSLGWYFVHYFAEGVIGFCFWIISCVAGLDRVELLRGDGPVNSLDSQWLLVGSKIVSFWIKLVRAVALAFTFSFFWSSLSAIYLLLRRDVDHTELDEIYLQVQEEQGDFPSFETQASK
ncbi:MAG: hypothetical protein CMJ81_22355 [Planctomycetaceae bacterium]|nr:hypothetical protein [Planctomycetaceae bacterium]MBP62280.1 hypothetical protein [Planctomycetaceae bacterium]